MPGASPISKGSCAPSMGSPLGCRIRAEVKVRRPRRSLVALAFSPAVSYDLGHNAAHGAWLHLYRAGSEPARVELAPLTHRRHRPPASLPSSDSRRIWRIEENVSGGFITSHKVHRSNRRGPGGFGPAGPACGSVRRRARLT